MSRRVIVALSVLLIGTTACGGGGDTQRAGPTTSALPEGPTSTVAAAAPDTSLAPSQQATATTAGGTKRSPATTARRAAQPPPAPPAATAAAPSPAAVGAAGPSPIAAGTYRYRQSGTSKTGGSSSQTPPEGTLKVDPAGGDGAQTLHRAVDPSGVPSDNILLFRPDGMFLHKVITRASGGGQQMEFTCTFDPPVPLPPWPPAVGKTFAGHGQCGSFTADLQGKIAGQRSVTLDGIQVEVYVVESTFITRGQVESTANRTDWFAPSLRLPVHVENHQKGSYGFFSFSDDLTADLVSAHPGP